MTVHLLLGCFRVKKRLYTTRLGFLLGGCSGYDSHLCSTRLDLDVSRISALKTIKIHLSNGEGTILYNFEMRGFDS